MFFQFALLLLFCALPRSRSQDAPAEIHFPDVCPNEDSAWCKATHKSGKECNYRRPDGSAIFKLLDNVWYNCPQHCFGCRFPGNELNITFADLVRVSENFQLPAPTSTPSVELIEFWLEQRTVEEAFRGPCEDAAGHGESGETDVCQAWIDSFGPSFCQAQGIELLDPKNPRQDFSTIKGNGWWWCKQSCRYCE